MFMRFPKPAALSRLPKPDAGMPCAMILALLVGLLNTMIATPVAAQGLGWFGNLFGGGFPRPGSNAPAYPSYNNGGGYTPRTQSDTYYARPRHRLPRRVPVERVQQGVPKEKPAALPPKNASMFVYVFGDSLGQLLANGLDDALVDRQDVALISKARGQTGLVATDTYDWPKSIADLLAGRNTLKSAIASKAEGTADPASRSADAVIAKPLPKDDAPPTKLKIDVAVMMIGSNDRRPLQIDGKTVQPGAPEWAAAYSRRVIAIDEAFRAKNIPLVWVGVPITKDDGFADVMAALNDVYREAAAKTGAVYVDTWEAFSDDSGNFSSYGPDINGQTVRLRAADGIQFTRAGARKLAHFVEAHVRRALEGKTPISPQLPTAESPDGHDQTSQAKESGAKQIVVARPEAGPIRSLNDPPSAASGTLATFDLKAGVRDGRTENAILHGSAANVPAGRADNARWPSGTGAEP